MSMPRKAIVKLRDGDCLKEGARIILAFYGRTHFQIFAGGVVAGVVMRHCAGAYPGGDWG